jgi:hypothetical protein
MMKSGLITYSVFGKQRALVHQTILLSYNQATDCARTIMLFYKCCDVCTQDNPKR